MRKSDGAVKKLRRLKLRLGVDLRDDSKDAVLTMLLEDAGDKILAYTRRNETQWLKLFDAAQIQVAAADYGRLGAEGVKSQGEGSISTSFVDGFPDDVVKTLKPYRRIKGI